jgi:hypothetical protein
MNYDVERWGMEYERGEWDIVPKPDGEYVLIAEARAHEKKAVAIARDCHQHDEMISFRCEHYQTGKKVGYEQAIRDCIEIAQQAYRQAPEGYSDNEAFEIAIAALRALQDKT